MLTEEEQLMFWLLMGAAIFGVGLMATRRRRRYKVRPMNRNRRHTSVYKNIVQFAANDDLEQFFKYTRMTPAMFHYLLALVEPRIKRDPARHPIPPGQRLSVTLHYLAEGCSMQEVAWNNYIGLTTAHCIIKETCEVLWDVLQPRFLQPPSEQRLEQIAEENFRRWNVPNCMGSLDGKLVEIQCPKDSGSAYFSYKKTFSMVLMAVCDAYYKFTYVDIGAPGSNHDAVTFTASAFGKALVDGTLPIPAPQPLPGSNQPFPFFFAADQAFPIHINIMKPFPGEYLNARKRIFNMRLSRVRRTVENTFGILVQRWRRLRSPILGDVDTCLKIIKAVVALHNFIQANEADLPVSERRYCPTGLVDWVDNQGTLHPGAWRNEVTLRGIRQYGPRGPQHPFHLREALADYFVSDVGGLPNQWDRLYVGGVPDHFVMEQR